VLTPLLGRIGDLRGRKWVLALSVGALAAGSLLAYSVHNWDVLIIARVLIGVGTSAGYPSAMLLIRRRAESAGLDAPPGGVLGGLVIAGAATVAVGLPIGGLLVAAWGWRTTFFVNVPVALITLAMAAFWIPRDPPAAGKRSIREVATRIDAAGIVGFGTAMAALLVFLLSLPRPDWIALGVAAAVGAALLTWELRASHPFFDVRLLATNLALTRTYLRFAVATLCAYTVLYGLTQWLEAGRGLSPEEAGLLILPMTGLSAVIVRPVSQRNLVRAPLIIAAASCLAGSAGVLTLTTRTPVVWIVVVTLIFGVTLGTAASANQTTLYAQVPSDLIGTASGLFRTFGYIGSIASSAVISLVFRTSVSDHGLHSIAWIMVAVSAAGLLLVLADRTLMRQVRAGSAGPPVEPSQPAHSQSA